MPRIRSIKPEFFDDPDMAADLSLQERLVYIGLWTMAYDNWTMEYDPRKVRRTLFGYDDAITDEIVAGWVARIIETGRAIEFVHEGKKCLYLHKCAEHQVVNRPSRSPITLPDSLRTHALLIEDSPMEQVKGAGKGAGKGREQGAGYAPPTESKSGTIPKCLSTGKFKRNRTPYSSPLALIGSCIEAKTGSLATPQNLELIIGALTEKCHGTCSKPDGIDCGVFAAERIERGNNLRSAAKFIRLDREETL